MCKTLTSQHSELATDSGKSFRIGFHNSRLRMLNLLPIFLIKIYRLALSPLLGPRCRFYPSCSEYSLESFKKYSFSKASFMTLKRLSKCHPLNPGGVDLP